MVFIDVLVLAQYTRVPHRLVAAPNIVPRLAGLDWSCL